MKKLLVILAAVILVALPLTAQTYISQAGSTFFVAADATKTQTATVAIPNKSANGNLLVTTTSITGSPSGCTFAMYSLGANSSTAPAAAEQTPSVTITTGTHTQVVAALSASDITTDQVKLVYACSTYPTAGTLTLSFAPLSNIATGALTITTPAQVTNYNSGSLTVTPLATLPNPCENPSVAKTTAVVAISTATTTQIIPVSGATTIYLCSFAATFGASTTASLEYGTSTNCTGTHALTGVMAPSTGAFISWGAGHEINTPASQGLCVVSTGTGGINGFATYIQQ